MITAQVPLVFRLDSKSVSVSVFVQPDSTQSCLLGINAMPAFGIHMLHENGEAVLSTVPNSSTQREVATVSLVESVVIPSIKGRVV